MPEASDNYVTAKSIKIPFKGESTIGDKNNLNYFYIPTEVRARLNEWRFNHNIDPTKNYTNEEIQQIIDNDIKAGNSGNFDLYKVIRGRGDLLKQINDSYVSTGDKEDPDEIPKAQRGLATAADSSYVASGANAPHDFYKNAGYTILPTNPSTDIRPSGIFEALANRRALMYYDPLRPIDYSEYTNYKPGEHRFEQRELTAGNINKNAPRSKYDDRILPQGIVTYASTLDAFDANGDVAEVPKYDKLAVTPWGKLSKSQKLQRLQKFGTSGTPFAGQSTKKHLQLLKTQCPSYS